MSKINFKKSIIWENDDYLVINKPPFVSSLDDRNDQTTILSLARAYHADAQLCHRLDKETSGVLVIAKNPEAYRHMSLQFENRTVKKVYHAVVDGIHDYKEVRYSQPIYKMSNGVVKIDKRGKDAVTYFQTLKAYKEHTLVECKPVTGRMHQIRVHLSYQHSPITGDLQYGGRPLLLSNIKKNYNLKKGTEELPLIKRLALHAHTITIKLLNDEEMTFEAERPKDFKVLIKQLEKNS